MKRLLIISFDLIREGESEKSLAISSLVGFLKADDRYGKDFVVNHISINMYTIKNSFNLHKHLKNIDYNIYDYIALSAYIWNEYLINPLMASIKTTFGFSGDFILGGYQISYSQNPQKEYPLCTYFISGYAEQSLLDIISNNTTNFYLDSKIDFKNIPSPYLTGELQIVKNQEMVRLETKRGCPYRCTFCAHRDLNTNRVHKGSLDKVFQELEFFKKKEVKKINIIDPIFNAGTDYLLVMEKLIDIRFSGLVSVQARFETIKGDRGRKFLDLCSKLNMNLEFGLQTASEQESNLINRKNNPEVIKQVMSKLKQRNIPFEISLIYGLPSQTLKSFKESIDFAYTNGCKKVTAFPLMLLKGTELYDQKSTFLFKEKIIGDFNIPIVVESDSFSESEWKQMEHIANQLAENVRV
ncbi:B12-binding domain-containing radical SAM protein [Dokdonia pacifica]|uniref:B12-binding domain-containing radical SAM protein n=1 Tax=Dokdonia pacifica TaxID=1627892 RepID=UPI001178BBF2|nr:radical SAM protein [Dokdonia pacifica]